MANGLSENLKRQRRSKSSQHATEKKAGAQGTKKIRNRTYEVVAVSLYSQQSEWLNQTSEALQRVSRKYNRSSLVQEALQRLQEDFKGMIPERMDDDIHHRQRKRSTPA